MACLISLNSIWYHLSYQNPTMTRIFILDMRSSALIAVRYHFHIISTNILSHISPWLNHVIEPRNCIHSACMWFKCVGFVQSIDDNDAWNWKKVNEQHQFMPFRCHQYAHWRLFIQRVRLQSRFSKNNKTLIKRTWNGPYRDSPPPNGGPMWWKPTNNYLE